MKKYIVLLLALLFASQAYSQKKEKEDAKDLKIDSLTSLTLQMDSISKSLKVYYGLYTTIKDKVIKSDFDPANMAQIIDSLAAKRDSTFSSLLASASLVDSISVLKKDIASLTALLGGTKAEEEALNSMVIQLKQLKELLDANILTQTEFDMMKFKLLHNQKP